MNENDSVKVKPEVTKEYKYSKKEVVKTTGMTERQVQFFTEQKVVIPEVKGGKGKGSNRKYSWKNLFDLCIVKQLAHWGLTISSIKRFMEDFKKPGKHLVFETQTSGDRYRMPMLRKNSDGVLEYVHPTITMCYPSEDDEFDVYYSDGSGKNVVTKESIRRYESAMVINLGQIHERLNRMLG